MNNAEKPQLTIPRVTSSVLFSRVWAMPNKLTFTIKPIKELVEKYHGVTADGMVESALHKVRIIESFHYENIVISIKTSGYKSEETSDLIVNLKPRKIRLSRKKNHVRTKTTISSSKPNTGLRIIAIPLKPPALI